jgi:SAM-dependent methyltransferase
MFKCYLCGNNSAECLADKSTIRFGIDREVLKCLQCGLVQLYPREELPYSWYSEKKDFPGFKTKKRISSYLPKYLGNESKAKMMILEVGCGHGDNLRYLYEKGYHTAYGIDKDPSVCRKSSIYCQDWKNHYPLKKLDAIYGIHFLEHVSDPIEFMIWVTKNLNKNGKFIFEIPCIDDPLIKLYKNKAYDKFCWYPYHMFFYSKASIKDVLCRFNIKVIRKQSYGLINHLRWLFYGKPGNWNPNIPILDGVYKFILESLGYSDTLIIVGENV